MKRGPKPHTPTDEQRRTVEALAGYGIPHYKICKVIGLSEPTLGLYYGDELDRGAASVEANLIGNLLRLSKGSDGTALKAIMFSLQTRFGWSQFRPEYERHEELGKKEARQIHAQTAHEGTEWGDLLN